MLLESQIGSRLLSRLSTNRPHSHGPGTTFMSNVMFTRLHTRRLLRDCRNMATVSGACSSDASAYYCSGPFRFQFRRLILDTGKIPESDLILRDRPFLIDAGEDWFPQRLRAAGAPLAGQTHDTEDFPAMFHVEESLIQDEHASITTCDDAICEAVRPRLSAWAEACRWFLDDNLTKFGAIVLRGLPFAPSSCYTSEEEMLVFPDFLRATRYKMTSYVGGVTQRMQQNDDEVPVYPASDENSKVCMDLHQDNTYWPVQPAKLLFLYEKPADVGGLNPLLDMRMYLRALREAARDDAFLREGLDRLEREGVRYENWYPDKQFDNNNFVSWQKGFGTDDTQEVEAKLVKEGFGFEWVYAGARGGSGSDGDGIKKQELKGLRKWNVLSPMKTHPVTGEHLWVNMVVSNHASYFHAHPSFPELAKTSYSDVRSTEDSYPYPFNIRYGGGGEIPYEAVLQKLRKLAWELAVGVKAHAGDLLVIDNYRVQHGRLGYEGSRKLWLGISLD
mmetsp:Transcript_43023/g.85201  ORF Transcript_43023/g.85201 Transcript_43023/m.85201 type:complete len:503 (-) Transcript_43023:260-1768(-)